MWIFCTALLVALAIGGVETTTAFVVVSSHQQRYNSAYSSYYLASTTVSRARVVVHHVVPSPSQEGDKLYPKTRTTRNTALQSSFLDSVERFFERRGTTSSNTRNRDDTATSADAEEVVRRFFQAYDNGEIDVALSLWKNDNDNENGIEFADVSFYNSLTSKSAMERQWRLQHDTAAERNRKRLVIDDMAIDSNTSSNKVGVKFHYELLRRQTTDDNSNDDDECECWIPAPNGRGCALVQLVKSNTSNDNDNTKNNNNNHRRRLLISRVLWVLESSNKGGQNGLKLLNLASKIIGDKKKLPVSSSSPTSTTATTLQQTITAPEAYFQAWNRRNMDDAVAVFSDDVIYDDTAFPQPFAGKHNLRNHLFLCADCFPTSFQFIVDNVVHDQRNKKKNTVCVEWHVENNNQQLPFTRGCSFYVIDGQTGLIQEGTDFVEPAVIKPGLVQLFSKSMASKFTEERIRFVPLICWIAYMYIVFFSDGILPGANALQLELRTWQEVRDLSLNFFFVAPLLNLPFSTSTAQHPMLEGVFNLLLSWAALFAGFLSDDRKDKPNWFPMLPAVIGMQFLTSAFLLPYLAIRTTERRGSKNAEVNSSNPVVTQEELSVTAKFVGESRLLGPAMGIVGTGSIAWFFNGRVDDYGSLFSERWVSFVDLLSIDRVGSSFLVDLAIFGLFQHWLVDDDMKRRQGEEKTAPSRLLVNVAKYVPFFGLVVYLTLRPSFPSSSAIKDSAAQF